MKTSKLQNRLTSFHCGTTVPATQHRVHRPATSSGLLRVHPLVPFVASGSGDLALRLGMPMSSQSVFARFSIALLTCVAIIALFSTSNVRAQEAAPRVLTLDEAIQIAVTNNRSLKIVSLEVD